MGINVNPIVYTFSSYTRQKYLVRLNRVEHALQDGTRAQMASALNKYVALWKRRQRLWTVVE